MESLNHLILEYGYIAIFIGAFLDHSGFPIPIILASTLAVEHPNIDINLVLIISIAGAILSDLVAYSIGRWVGSRIYYVVPNRFHPKIEATEKLFLKNSNKIVLWGRFFHIIGRFIGLVSGIYRLNLAKFILHSLIGITCFVSVFCYLTYFTSKAALTYFLGGNIKLLFLAISVIVVLRIIWKVYASNKQHIKSN